MSDAGQPAGMNGLLNGANPDMSTSASDPRDTTKTAIPMQEVSAVREEPTPASVAYLPSDDRSTAAAASAAVASDHGREQEAERTTMQSLPGAEETTKASIEGPGHEADVRGSNGSGMATVQQQAGDEEEERRQAGLRQDLTAISSFTEKPEQESLSSSIGSLPAPGSQNPYNQSEEAVMASTRPTQTETQMTTPADSLDASVDPAANGVATSMEPSVEMVAPEKENVLSPVKLDGEALGPPVSVPHLSPQPTAASNIAEEKIVSAVDEPARPDEAKVEATPLPASNEQEAVAEDVKMEDANDAPTSVVASEGMAAAAPAVAGLGGASADATTNADEPPSKRQRKSVSAGLEGDAAKPQATTSLAGPDATSMTAAQIKFCQNAVKSLKGRPESSAFVAPVDPIALGIPHYPDIVKEPMDLGTIDIKLALTAAAAKGGNKPTDKTKSAALWNLDPVQDVYNNVEAFERDVRLVFSNCVRFNGPDHVLSISAKNLEAVFEKQLKTLPPTAPPPTATAPAPVAAASSASLANGDVPAMSASSSNGARRASESRPKRDIHPPAPKDLPYSDRPGSGVAGGKKKSGKGKRRPLTAREEVQLAKVTKDQLKFVSKIVDDFHKPPLSQYAWVFFEKPSMDMDFAPSYYSIVKKPISLKEIKARLARSEYETVEETKSDIELMLNNCFLFNQRDSDVWTMGNEVKKAWELKLQKMPQPPPLEEEEEEEEEEEDDEEDAANEAQAQQIREQIANLQAMLEGLTGTNKAATAKMMASAKASLAAMPASKKNNAKKRRPSEAGSGVGRKSSSAGGSSNKKARTPSAGGQSVASAGTSLDGKKSKSKKQSSGGGGGSSKRAAEDDIRDVSYEQKEELAAKITQLPDDRLDGALKIIAEDKPASANDDEEIELDIDDLSPQTLYKLYRYVVRPKGKKAPSKISASDGRKRGTGGVKRKNLDEGEEAARIARLQEQLQQFNPPDAGDAQAGAIGGGAGHAGAHDDLVASESSSGEDDSDSESEFE